MPGGSAPRCLAAPCGCARSARRDPHRHPAQHRATWLLLEREEEISCSPRPGFKEPGEGWQGRSPLWFRQRQGRVAAVFFSLPDSEAEVAGAVCHAKAGKFAQGHGNWAEPGTAPCLSFPPEQGRLSNTTGLPGAQDRRWGVSPILSLKMLPGKAEKRIASSVYITLVPPRREPASAQQIQPQLPPAPSEAPKSLGAHQPRTPPEGDVPAAGRPAPRAPGLPNGGSSGPDPAVQQPSSLPFLLLSKAPQPLCAEMLAPALQQLNVAAPAALQAASTFPAELRQPELRPTCLERAGEGPPLCHDVNGHPERDFSSDVCAFCHKAVGPRDPTVEAMGKQYHADCFTCRTCQRLLAGQRYYQKDGRPICDACHKATLEKCAKCQVPILEHIVRALGKGYHPGCFACAACGRVLGDESFAAGERDEVYCVDDFYRRYASVCSVCRQPIVPREDKDTYKIECLGRSFHESCYRCERCRIPLSPEPTENGCYPLGNRLLCKSCHIAQRDESSC
ncbi:filamin-binding LIM protein 1 isoform X5 [Struthio camelus]|uniref:filamin-binding LIM protein 1 isoform X5 n=1 Tax=Struthio camelus TaxID=8801 RepID=UPI003603E900